MSFLQPILLIGLPLALLPIIIHLINQHRHRTVKWAAMMFLLDAKKMTKGMARLRQILILAMRVLAVIALLFAASRPLAGGWLAMTGGGADTILILLDRSASMEQQNLESGTSKRTAALEKIAELIDKTGNAAEIVLIDSATLTPTPIANPESIVDLPQTAPTATAADIPALLERGIDYLTVDESGRTDIWLISDLRQSDWNTGSGQWQTIRAKLSAKESARLFLLNYPDASRQNLAISVSGVERRKTPEGHQLVMDLKILRSAANAGDNETVRVEFTVNGTRTVEEIVLSGEETIRLGHTLPLGKSATGSDRGWGRVDLPADDNLVDNTAYFVFDDEAVRKTVIVSADPTSADAIRAAASSAVETSSEYEALIFEPSRTAEIPWDDTALLFWQAPLPAADTTDAALLQQHAENGRALVLLPPEDPSGESLFGFTWGEYLGKGNELLKVNWWRTESGLLANTKNGNPLPIGELNVFQARATTGEIQPLLKLETGEAIIGKLISETPGPVYMWATLPRSNFSTLASDGIAFFVMIHRALEEGVTAVSPARFESAAFDVLSRSPSAAPLDNLIMEEALTSPELLPGAFQYETADQSQRLLALNRPVSEDDLRTVDSEGIAPLLDGVEYREIRDEVDNQSSLASEIWKVFLITMALALLIEAALCLPPRLETEAGR
ncbi:MAG: BatA domain-containing protein [Verrucomicrobiales bacterium]|nr:BatA domain-containing protein [Verrucomicrobiales bacterium]